MQHDEELTTGLAHNLDMNFKHLVGAYQQRLYSAIQARTGNRQESEEIIQEAFLRAYCALRDYPPERIHALKIRPWLERIAQNVLNNRLRTPVLPCISLDLPEQATSLDMPDPVPLPEETITRHEQRHELVAFVTALPEPYRAVIDRHYFQDMTYQEIAQQLGQPIGTIKARLHYARTLLRKALPMSYRKHIGK